MDNFAFDVHKALLTARSQTPTAKAAPKRRANAVIGGAGRRNSGFLPFMRHAGMKPSKTKKAIIQQAPLTAVDEDMRDDHHELEGMLDMLEENDFDIPITNDDINGAASDSGSDAGSRFSDGNSVSSHQTSRDGVTKSYNGSMLGSKSVSRAGGASGLMSRDPLGAGTLSALSDADRALPFKPFCQKCGPKRPTDCLCLKPDSLGRIDIEQVKQSVSTVVETVQGKKVAAVVGDKRRQSAVGVRRKSAAPMGTVAFDQKQDDNDPRKWTMLLKELKLPGNPTTSAFEGCGLDNDDERSQFLCKDSEKPVVLHSLTPWEITRIECWAIQHVKKQYLDICVLAHAEAPVSQNKHRENMHSSTICQLVRKAAKKQLDDVEWAFMIAKLRHYPLLRDLPKGMLEDIAEELDVRTYARGSKVFEMTDIVDGIYILVQGDAELTDGDVDTMGAGPNVKSAPSVILLEDVVQTNTPTRPFLLKPVDQRVRSRTVRAWDDDDASTMAMMLWLPFSVIAKAASYHRKREAHDRIDLIVKLFAPALRLDKAACERNCALFELETFSRDFAILQQGSKPSMDQARLGMIVEGEVRLVRHDKKSQKQGVNKRFAFDFTPAAKDRVGPGKVLGESALYGEPFPHYAMVLSQKCTVLTVKVSDFFEKLLMRPAVPLEKPLICAGTILFNTQDGRVAEKETEKRETESIEKGVESAAKPGSELQGQGLRELRVALDNSAVKASEWKTVPSKHMLKWRQPPACRPHKTISATSRNDLDFQQIPDLNYPKDFDLFPSAQRSVLAEAAAQCRSASPDGSLAATTVPGSRAFFSSMSTSDEWQFASLDDKIQKKLVDAEELEAEHYLHTFLGVYMEDADRSHSTAPSSLHPICNNNGRASVCNTGGRASALSVSRPKTTPVGRRHQRRPPGPVRNAVLLTCGGVSMSARPQVRAP